MAGIDTGGGHGKRSSNHEVPLIPFSDFLLCLVMFLLVTAVWSHMARIEADARVPGKPKDEPEEPPKPEKQLHVEMRGERKFQLKWKEGTTVVSEAQVVRTPQEVGDDVTFPDLAKKIESEWQSQGSHKNPTDKKFDRAVLHTDNNTQFKDLIAVLDAIYMPQREYTIAGGSTEELPAFQVTFASD